VALAPRLCADRLSLLLGAAGLDPSTDLCLPVLHSIDC